MKGLRSDREPRSHRVRGQEMDANTDKVGEGEGLKCGHKRESEKLRGGPNGWWTWPRHPPSSRRRKRS